VFLFIGNCPFKVAGNRQRKGMHYLSLDVGERIKVV
jgi:hypothetical protein